MLAGIGTHKGRSMEELVIKEPGYIHWMLGQKATGSGLSAMQGEAKRLIKKFDAKPFAKRCFSCGAPVTRFSVYMNNVSPMFWCATCDPYSQGANPGKLQIFDNYDHALLHVQFFCNGNKGDYRDLIKEIAKAKGMPARVGASQLASFFA
jgi:hypothetical protein